MIRLDTQSLDSFLEGMKKYPPEFVTFRVLDDEGRYRHSCTLIESSFLYRGQGATLLEPKFWVKGTFTYDPKASSSGMERSGYVLTESCSNRMEAVRALRALHVPEDEIEKLKSVKVKQIKEMVDESDDDIDYLSIKVKAEGEEFLFTPGDLKITVRACKDSGSILKIIIDYSDFIEKVKLRVKGAIPPGVPFFQDTRAPCVGESADS